MRSAYQVRWNGQKLIAVDPYRFKGGLIGVSDLAKLLEVECYAGIPGGTMFIGIPGDDEVAVMDMLIGEAYGRETVSASPAKLQKDKG